MLSSREDVMFYTQQLVQINSVVNTEGERTIAEALYAMMSSFSYFQEFPDRIVKEKTIEDERDRFNIMGYVKGTKSPSEQTVILMGHLDTVDIDDFGRVKDLACDPVKLAEALLHEDIPSTVREHLQSDEWMFGRGALDMKSGVASQLFMLKYFAEHPEELTGNLVFLAVCDEEDGSHGMLSAVEHLNRWKKEHHFDYIAAINAEFVSPRFRDDPNRYIYKGTVGKLLPTFFVTGAETHVGSCFEGIDPNFIAAELTRQINYNPELCDQAHGETTLPPVSLKQSDLKSFYTVQTASGAYVYFNFFVHSWSPDQVLSKLLEQAEIAMEQAVSQFHQRHQAYSELINEPYREKSWKPQIWTYQEMHLKLTGEYGEEYIHHMEQFKEKLLLDEELDMRMFSVRVVEEARKWMDTQQPMIVLFYSSLYSPASTLTGSNDKEIKLDKAVTAAIEQLQPYYPQPIESRAYFPYISDMSFLQVRDDQASLQANIENNPGWGSKHWVDYESIGKLNIPFINIGPYGVDAHNKYERVELKYSTEIVPNLTYQVIKRLLGE